MENNTVAKIIIDGIKEVSDKATFLGVEVYIITAATLDIAAELSTTKLRPSLTNTKLIKE